MQHHTIGLSIRDNVGGRAYTWGASLGREELTRCVRMPVGMGTHRITSEGRVGHGERGTGVRAHLSNGRVGCDDEYGTVHGARPAPRGATWRQRRAL